MSETSFIDFSLKLFGAWNDKSLKPDSSGNSRNSKGSTFFVNFSSTNQWYCASVIQYFAANPSLNAKGTRPENNASFIIAGHCRASGAMTPEDAQQLGYSIGIKGVMAPSLATARKKEQTVDNIPVIESVAVTEQATGSLSGSSNADQLLGKWSVRSVRGFKLKCDPYLAIDAAASGQWHLTSYANSNAYHCGEVTAAKSLMTGDSSLVLRPREQENVVCVASPSSNTYCTHLQLDADSGELHLFSGRQMTGRAVRQ